MPGRVNAVTIEVATESRRCAIISVQNNTVSMQFVYALDSLSNYANCTTILHPFLTNTVQWTLIGILGFFID
jgi:hypothetical protein